MIGNCPSQAYAAEPVIETLHVGIGTDELSLGPVKVGTDKTEMVSETVEVLLEAEKDLLDPPGLLLNLHPPQSDGYGLEKGIKRVGRDRDHLPV